MSLAPRGTTARIAARPDFIAAVAAMIGVLVFDTLPGLVIGMGLSLLLLVFRASRPHVTGLGRTPEGNWIDLARHRDAKPVADVAVVRCDGGLWFANADLVREAVLDAADGARAVVLDAETMPGVDLSGAQTLQGLDRELAAKGVDFYLAHDLGQVRDVLRRADINLDRTYPTVEEAVTAAQTAERT